MGKACDRSDCRRARFHTSPHPRQRQYVFLSIALAVVVRLRLRQDGQFVGGAGASLPSSRGFMITPVLALMRADRTTGRDRRGGQGSGKLYYESLQYTRSTTAHDNERGVICTSEPSPVLN